MPANSFNEINRSIPSFIMNHPSLSDETSLGADSVSSQKVHKSLTSTSVLFLCGYPQKRCVAQFSAIFFNVSLARFDTALKSATKDVVRVHGAKAPKELIGRVPNSRSVGFTKHSSPFSSSSSASCRPFVVGVFTVAEIVVFVVIDVVYRKKCAR